ncbi:uncharacterized protein EV422DRAFT_135972 [Fimicolochytrium jonesii]|uniref:uncharacterized protein n=1 Tax=Fimicolochytrium jonesii TaxID=1396493 RepID=UPI0022FEF6EA|nr:uncharacterized protein EV422DRAFT_135972 [Fimicolochytrium jonesii]KAI8825664.1 hypothetical protein EV422DRAFT_135972 [Fimicolochytrium jonesii]
MSVNAWRAPFLSLACRAITLAAKPPTFLHHTRSYINPPSIPPTKMSATSSTPGVKDHHLPNGKFTNPWPSFVEHGLLEFAKRAPMSVRSWRTKLA